MSILQNLIVSSPVAIGGSAYDFSKYEVDASIKSFADAELESKLKDAAFFLMTGAR